ncbi:small ubiquitin-related modifier 2-like [Vombatus ursinus]|uniref:small ubiquitin-related modifier 2-like n=1 Tax=Vombatus ursinus TaxID=29139 RepID=UPI000FFCE477|nr:small ubiquitin-related modifier 2-like [Vombatus ursinus]
MVTVCVPLAELLLLVLLLLLLFLTITTILLLLPLLLLLLPLPWRGPSWCSFCKVATQETPGLAMDNEKPEEVMETENKDRIILKVAGQDGSVVQFNIKKYTSLGKLMRAYCQRQGFSMRQIRFRFDGQPINATDTPEKLEMEDEDIIDVFQQQTGGAY